MMIEKTVMLMTTSVLSSQRLTFLKYINYTRTGFRVSQIIHHPMHIIKIEKYRKIALVFLSYKYF